MSAPRHLLIWLALACLPILPLVALGKRAGCRLSVETDLIMLRRSYNHDTALVVSAGRDTAIACDPLPAGDPYITSSDLINQFNFEPTLSVALTLSGTDASLELRYVDSIDWSSDQAATCPLNLSFPADQDVLKFSDASDAATSYRSSIYQGEITLHRHLTPRYIDRFSVSILGGIGYFDLHETLKVELIKPELETDRIYRIKTSSRLIGPHLGATFEYNPYPLLTWGLTVSAGALLNRGEQRSSFMGEVSDLITLTGNDSGFNFAYTAHTYPFIELRLFNHLTVKLSYEMRYLGAISTAERQFKVENIDKLSSSGSAIYHGGIVGVKFGF